MGSRRLLELSKWARSLQQNIAGDAGGTLISSAENGLSSESWTPYPVLQKRRCRTRQDRGPGANQCQLSCVERGCDSLNNRIYQALQARPNGRLIRCRPSKRPTSAKVVDRIKVGFRGWFTGPVPAGGLKEGICDRVEAGKSPDLGRLPSGLPRPISDRAAGSPASRIVW